MQVPRLTTFARISYQSTCVKIRTSSAQVISSETKRDYYTEEFSIRRTSKSGFGDSAISPSKYSTSLSSENQHRMPIASCVVAHRHIYTAAATLAGGPAGSKRSSCAVRLSNLNILGVPGPVVGGRKASATLGDRRVPLLELNKQLGGLLNGSVKGAILAESRRHYAKGMDKPKSKKTQVVVNETEMEQVIDVRKLKSGLEKIIEGMKEDYMKNLSIRGAAGALESLQVEFDGETYPLQELAQVGRKNPQLAVLNLASLPDAIKPVLKAIEDSGMGLNPQQEGTTIYVPLPKVTREHRENLAKNAKALFTKYKTDMQGVQNKYIKQCRAQKELSDDLTFSVQQQIMKVTENYVQEAEKVMQLKQKELLEK